MRSEREAGTTRGVATLLLSTLLLAVPLAAVGQDELPDTYDGLVRVPDSKVAVAYIDPEADFSVYDKVMILDCYVAFRKDWQRDQTRTGSAIRVTASDMDKIKAATAELFREVFTEKLSEEGGYEIVEEAGDDVLLVRPAIIDLDITAPDTQSAGRTRTYTTNSGAASLYVELYDSVSGDILARAADRQSTRSVGYTLSYTTRVTNRADAKRMLGKWADLLRAALDEYHGK